MLTPPLPLPLLQCYKIIFAYMAFAVFQILFFLTGVLLIQLMQVINLHIDAFSFCFLLYNFSVSTQGGEQAGG